MEYAFSIIMLVFGGAMMFYAGLLALTKDVGLIPKTHAASIPDKKHYASQFAKTIAIIAAAPLVSAAAGLFGNGIVNAVVAIVSFVVCFIIAIKTFKPVPDEQKEKDK